MTPIDVWSEAATDEASSGGALSPTEPSGDCWEPNTKLVVATNVNAAAHQISGREYFVFANTGRHYASRKVCYAGAKARGGKYGATRGSRQSHGFTHHE
jgi:hypothetical protein